MPTLKEINEKFMLDAALVRYSYKAADGREHWAISPPKWLDEMTGSVFRSIKYASDNAYMCAMDIDGPNFCEQSLVATSQLRLSFNRVLHVEPLLKASGMKGDQIISDVQFPKNWTEKHCLKGLAQTAYTVWKKSNIEKYLNVGFGLKLPGIYIDSCMFRKGRLLRGFSKHLKSGFYSVPFLYTDTFKTVRKRMSLEIEPLDFEIPVLWYPDIADKLLDYDDNYFLEAQPPSKAGLENLDGLRIKRGYHDDVYAKLTSRLQRVVDFDGDIAHDFKHPLVAYLHYELKMNADEIIEWIWNNCRWKDLNDLERTSYQVNWTCNWADDVIKEGRNPVKRWVYD